MKPTTTNGPTPTKIPGTPSPERFRKSSTALSRMMNRNGRHIPYNRWAVAQRRRLIDMAVTQSNYLGPNGVDADELRHAYRSGRSRRIHTAGSSAALDDRRNQSFCAEAQSDGAPAFGGGLQGRDAVRREGQPDHTPRYRGSDRLPPHVSQKPGLSIHWSMYDASQPIGAFRDSITRLPPGHVGGVVSLCPSSSRLAASFERPAPGRILPSVRYRHGTSSRYAARRFSRMTDVSPMPACTSATGTPWARRGVMGGAADDFVSGVHPHGGIRRSPDNGLPRVQVFLGDGGCGRWVS